MFVLLFTVVKGDGKSLTDASYAYKLKREKRLGPSTTSQELDEILENVKTIGELSAPELCCCDGIVYYYFSFSHFLVR